MAGLGQPAYGYLVTDDLPEVVVLLARLQTKAVEVRDPVLRRELTRVLDGVLDDVNRMAVEISALSETKVIANIYRSSAPNRPQTGDMATHVKSEPGPLGLISVGLIAELDKIINPEGRYGPYWRAQEFGTGQGRIPTQVGRRLYGTFEPSGTPPDSQQRGLRQGTDLAFFPGGRNPGLGHITVDLPGRHFLRDGFAEAAALYRRRCKEIDAKWSAQVDRIITEITALAVAL